MVYEEKLATLQKNVIFANVGEAILEKVVTLCKEKVFESHTTFIHEGDEPTDVYFINQGSVRVYRITEEGEEINLSLKGSGDVIGELSISDYKPRSANVATLQPTSALAIGKYEFRQLLNQYPQTSINLLKLFASRLREMDEYVESVLSSNLSEKTIAALQTLALHFPNKDITLSHEELASIIGATRSRVTEVLHELEKQGKITIEHKKIHVNG